MSKLEQQQDTSSKLGKAHFLDLSSQLVDEALNEALEEIEILTNTLFKIASATKKLDAIEDAEQEGAGKSDLGDEIKNLSQKALRQLQFADRMEQRLNNTSSNLRNMAKHESSELGSNEGAWNSFLLEVRNEFTMESEKILFDQFFDGIKSDPNQHANAIKNEDDNKSNTHLF